MINEEGFLSPQVELWTTVHRKRNAEWLTLARDLNRIAYRLTLACDSKGAAEDKWKWVARLLFLKTHESFQAAVTLAERGLTGDARSVLRTAFESMFCLGACKDDHMVELLVLAEQHYRKKTAKALLGLPTDLALDTDGVAKMQRFLVENPDEGGTLNVFQVAREAGNGLEHIYRVYYGDLSHGATHTSVSSLDRFVVKDAANNIVGMRQGPDVPDVGTALAYACVVAFYMLKLMAERFQQTGFEQEIDGLFPRYQVLLAKEFPHYLDEEEAS